MSTDDNNVIQFMKHTQNVTINHGETVIVIRPDGTKLRGGDMKPLRELERTELLDVIDKLCQLIARR